MSTQEPVDAAVSYRLPASVDDEWIDQVGPSLRALAEEPSVLVLTLDATELQVISVRGVGLLTALRLLTEQRGATLTVRNYPAGLSNVLDAARLETVAVPSQDPSGSLARIGPPPWWTAAAANA